MFNTPLTNDRSQRNFKLRKRPGVLHYPQAKITGSYVFYPQGGNMELFIYKKIIKSFRKRVRRNRYKLLFNFQSTYTVSSKGPNARMGKGKGKANRPSLSLKSNKLFLIVKGLSYYRVCFFFKKFYKQTGIRFLVYKIKKIW